MHFTRFCAFCCGIWVVDAQGGGGGRLTLLTPAGWGCSSAPSPGIHCPQCPLPPAECHIPQSLLPSSENNPPHPLHLQHPWPWLPQKAAPGPQQPQPGVPSSMAKVTQEHPSAPALSQRDNKAMPLVPRPTQGQGCPHVIHFPADVAREGVWDTPISGLQPGTTARTLPADGHARKSWVYFHVKAVPSPEGAASSCPQGAGIWPHQHL